MGKRVFDELEERLDFIEYRQELLFNNSPFSRELFECEVTRKEYLDIIKLLEEFQERINRQNPVSNGEYERRVYEIVPHLQGNYHFCKSVLKLLYENGDYKEVYIELFCDNSQRIISENF